MPVICRQIEFTSVLSRDGDATQYNLRPTCRLRSRIVMATATHKMLSAGGDLMIRAVTAVSRSRCVLNST